VPSARKFLDALRPYTIIADPVLITQDFAHLEGLSREEQLRRLRELADRGQSVAAVYTARKLYGCGLTEAKQMVESLESAAGEEHSTPTQI
jgi:ribosomal protein L7/L12